MTAGFLTVDKPRGISSNRVVSEVKKATGIKKVGHAGTLDPMATGAVVTAVGPVTRLIRFIQEQEKEYFATAQFGVATDTLDADGAVLSREPMDVDENSVTSIASRFIGTISQVPPMVSALKHEGKRLYELAREGRVVERDARPVQIYELEILEVGPPPFPEVSFRVVCGKGTYVRSLADDMASALGGSAHLTSLRRTRIGTLDLDSYGISMGELDRWAERMLTPAEALSAYPSMVVSGPASVAVKNGMPFVGGEMSSVTEDTPTRILDDDGRLLAIYRRTGEHIRPEVVIPT